MKRSVLVLLLLAPVLLWSQEKTIAAGMKIHASFKAKKMIYKLDAPADTASSVILIEGNNITIDFNNAELRGSNSKITPDEFFGVAICIRNSKKVTIKNLKARGYKVALLARNVEELVLDNCDLSYNYRQHLNSTQEKEDISDWMSYHHNEKDEWLRYGAAFYLRGCNKAVISNCKVTGGQNALMMMECNDAKIFNNDFSFNSGIGLGMYRCNHNEVSFNRINFNVRGHSEGVYNRGQDSAGILVYEQSSNNIFYKNSVTHGGDGFFLWAGQTTMDTGKGGCNDNLLLSNDFSYAPTNGIEVTFSRNYISNNFIFECDHGIWGGYSYGTMIEENHFRNNRIAIAIEHGQHNRIVHNLFLGDKEAIRLWSNKTQPSDWGYAKYHDTRSADYRISDNSFNSNLGVINISRTDSVNIFNNSYAGYITKFKFDSLVTHIDSTEDTGVDTGLVHPIVKNPKDPFAGNGKYIGRRNIMITEWGPYDFRSPIIWNTNPTDTTDIMKFDILGPNGKWKVIDMIGVENLSAVSGTFPATITAQKVRSDKTDIKIILEYTGEAMTTPQGEVIPAGKTYRFQFRKYFRPMNWMVEFYPLDTLKYNPLKNTELFEAGSGRQAFKTDIVKKIDYAWWGGIAANGKQYPQFITVANAAGSFDPGDYEISLTWDDAARLYIDDKLVISEWDPSKYIFDESPNRKIRVKLGGEHHFRLEHLELGGFATISLKIRPVE